MRQNIIILANSRKMGNRCIAGIDSDTGTWIRPVYGTGENGVPPSVRQINGQEPDLLDIISIPLSKKGPHREIQPENRKILRGPWKKEGNFKPGRLTRYCQRKGPILYNSDRRIKADAIRDIPMGKRKSLCLIKADVSFYTEATISRKKRVIANFLHDGIEYFIPVTDFNFERDFPAYGRLKTSCLLTLSLGMPYELDGYCYKFVAGVLEL